jgi:hypothetical protein
MPKLVYLPKSRRWHAFENMRYCCPLHCGDQIGIRVQDRYFPAVVNQDKKWYLLIDDVKFYLHPKERYDAILMF